MYAGLRATNQEHPQNFSFFKSIGWWLQPSFTWNIRKIYKNRMNGAPTIVAVNIFFQIFGVCWGESIDRKSWLFGVGRFSFNCRGRPMAMIRVSTGDAMRLIDMGHVNDCQWINNLRVILKPSIVRNQHKSVWINNDTLGSEVPYLSIPLFRVVSEPVVLKSKGRTLESPSALLGGMMMTLYAVASK